MKESVEAARSVVRARAKQLGLKSDIFANTDWHIHFPEVLFRRMVRVRVRLSLQR